MNRSKYDRLISPVLIYRYGDIKREGRVRQNMAVPPPAVETKTYIKEEIRTVLHKNIDEKYRQLKFEDVRRFFKSLSLEEERELSGLLGQFYENTPAYKVEMEERQDQIKALRTSMQSLWDQIQENETLPEQKQTQDEAAQIRSLTDNVLRQLTQELRIEKMRRGV